MTDAGKAALFIWWIMDELQIYQYLPTPITCDNHSTMKMANAQQPNWQTQHGEMKYFAVLQLTEDKFLK